jgi:hypothetical protein
MGIASLPLLKDAALVMNAGFRARWLLPKRLFTGWQFAENSNQPFWGASGFGQS